MLDPKSSKMYLSESKKSKYGKCIPKSSIEASEHGFQGFRLCLGNPSKERQRFVDTIISISTPDWSAGLSNFEYVVETQLKSVLQRC